MLQGLISIMADIMKDDELIDQMYEAITKYKANPTDENKKYIGFLSMMFLTKMKMQLTGQSVEQHLKDIETVKQATDAFKMKDNKN